MADPGYWESLLRGAGQGATANWSDEGAAKLLGLLPKPQDPEGIPREYAAGSPERDYLQTFRGDNAAAAQAHPRMYTAGQMLGAAPSAAAIPAGAGLSAAGRVAAAGLTGGALGGLAGAGGAQEGSRAREAGKGALLGSLLGTGSTAAMEAVPAAARALGGLRQPQTATASPEAIQINYERTPIVPPRRQSGPVEMPMIPKNSNPGFRESMIPKMDELAERADVVHGDKVLGRPSSEEDVAGFVKARDEAKGLGKKPEPTSDVKTVRPPRKKAQAPGKPAPEQTEIPGSAPEYSYHATPSENATAISELGLRPEQGGKNFAFKKNQGRVYMSGPEHAPMWAQKLEDFSGQKPLELRTPLRSEQVPGADPSVRIRTEPVPPERLQFKSPSGTWRSVQSLRGSEAIPGPNPNQLSLEDLLK